MHPFISPIILFLLGCPFVRVHKENHVYISLKSFQSPQRPLLRTANCTTGVQRFFKLISIYSTIRYLLDIGNSVFTVENYKVLLFGVLFQTKLLGAQLICVVKVAGVLLFIFISVFERHLRNEVSFAFKRCDVLNWTEVNHLIKV